MSTWSDQLTPSRTPQLALADALAQLRRDGVALIPRYIPEPVVADMRDGVPPIEEFERLSAPGPGDTMVYPGADRVQCFGPFFHDPRLRQFARAYIGSGASASRRMLEIRSQGFQRPSLDQPSPAEASRPHLYFLLYLCDVGESDGPLVYRKGSHGSMRRGLRERTGDLRRRLAAATTDRAPDEVTCCGPAGSLVIYDPSGIGRMLPRRKMLQVILVDCWMRGKPAMRP
jgi:hypothetical protein